MSSIRIIVVAMASLVSMWVRPVLALIDVSLQPDGVYDRSQVAMRLRIAAIDDEKHRVDLEVVKVWKGQFAPKRITLAVGNQQVQGAFQVLPKEGLTVVAFIQGNDLLFYAGGEGRWQRGERAGDDPSRWRWTADLNKQEFFGTFNGSEDRLAEMMDDKATGRYFFPAHPLEQFKPDMVIDRFDKPVRGVALHDIDGDGKLDVYACCESGNRAYLQTGPLKFVDVTEKLGLAAIKSSGCSFANVTGSGQADLLVDGMIYLHGTDGRLAKSDLLPASASQNLKCSAFVDINGDGYPDVVISKLNGGLHAYLNPGAKGGPFVDATTSLGLDTNACGAGQSGFFLHGNWADGGRVALFYSVRGGLLMAQDKGRFVPVELSGQYDFHTDGKDENLTGAGCFAPIWRPDRMDAVFSRDSGVNILANVGGKPFDAAQYGNELAVATMGCLTVAAEDMNADGNVDIYAASRSKDSPNVYYMNRGYGSFMVPTRYKRDVFPGPAHLSGAGGVAAGDADGDGTNDLLLGGVNGQLTLLANDTLSQRKARANPTAQEKVLEQTRILSVHVSGRVGVLGASVTLADDKGRIVARRDIGANMSTGCRGPDAANIAVLWPGAYLLKVRFSNGQEKSLNVDLTGKMHTRATISSDNPPH